MKLFGQVVRTIVNVAALPVAVTKDVLTLGGVITDTEPATLAALQRLKDESQEDQEPTP